MSCNLIGFCTDFLQWFRGKSLAYFSSLPRRSNISIRKTLERIRKSYSFIKNDLKHEITLANNLLLKESKLPISLEQFFHLQLLKKFHLIVTGGCKPRLHNSESSKGQIDQHKLAAGRKSLFRHSVEEMLKGQVIIRSRAFATFSATEFSRAARKDPVGRMWPAGRMLCRPGL